MSRTLALFTDNPNDATSWYRGVGPLAHMRRPGSPAFRPDIDIKVFSYADLKRRVFNWSDFALWDVVMLQRPYLADHLSIAGMAHQLNVPIWLDYDDDLTCVPADNPTHAVYSSSDVQNILRRLASIASSITVSTDALADRWARLSENDCINVIPNAIDENLFKERRPHKQVTKRIVWRGSATHTRDLLKYRELFKKVCAQTEYHFEFIGCNPWCITQDLPPHRFSVHPFENIVGYHKTLALLSPDVMFVPLEDTAFNRAKSNCAWLEATAVGAVTVANMSLPEFDRAGIVSAAFGVSVFKELESSGLSELNHLNEMSWGAIQKHYTLGVVNEKRALILDQLFDQRGADT